MNVPDKKPRRHRGSSLAAPEPPPAVALDHFHSTLTRSPEELLSGLRSDQVPDLIKLHGYNEVVSEKESFWWTVFKMYVQPINILVVIAAILSVAVTPEPILSPVTNQLETPERGWLAFALLLLLLNLFVWSDYLAEKNAGDAVSLLQERLKPVATVKRDGQWKELPARELVPGDVVLLVGGNLIAADVQLLHVAGDAIEVDESALTGESLPSKKTEGDEALSGGIVKVGEAQALVVRTGADSFFGKTITLLNASHDAGHLHTLLIRLTYVVTGVAAVFSIAFMVVLLVRQDHLNQFSDITLSPGTTVAMTFGLLAAAMPLAIPVITGAILAVGARELADVDVVVTRISSLEELAGCSVLCSDKTGTLTLNQLVMEPDYFIPDSNFSSQDLLVYAALASSWLKMDAIDHCIMRALKDRCQMEPSDLETQWQIHYSRPFDAVSKRTEAEVTDIGKNRRIRVSKGSPQVIQQLCQGGPELLEHVNAMAKRGLRTLGVAYRECQDEGQAEGPWQFVGYFGLFDPPRVDSREVLARAIEMGLHIKMITGDQRAIAEETMARLGMGRNVVHRDVLKATANAQELIELIENTAGFSGVYPEDKYSIVKGFQQAHHKVAMTGDGVNDAPALRKANVGVAVDGATDAARAAADIVMLAPGLSGIVTALLRARKIFHRLDSYLIFRIAVSVDVAVFFFLAAVGLDFIVPTYVIVLIALINDIIMISMSFDYVMPSKLPVEWNMTKVITTSCLISLFCIGPSLLFVHLARPLSEGGVDWWVSFGSSSISSYQAVAASFLQINVSIQLSIFSARTEGPFWTRRPGIWVLLAIFLGILTSTLIAALWTIEASLRLGDGALMDGLYSAKNVFLIYFYCIVWFLVAEFFKTISHLIWEKIAFQDQAHYAQFFEISGWKRTQDVPEPSKQEQVNEL